MDSLEKLQQENSELKELLSELKKEIAKQKSSNNDLLIKTKGLEKEINKLKKDSQKETAAGASRRFNMVTVLYSSIRGFGMLTEKNNAKSLVDDLDQFYYHFDTIADEYNIRTIKSIGDTFMCAGGIPKKNRTNPIEVVIAALEIQSYLKSKASGEDSIWNIGLGIHTGPVVATISGKRKINYELKGDTVNIAHRIDAAIEPGKVIISAMTYEFVRPYFDCEYVGSMPVKYTGDIALYEVTGFKEKFRLGENHLRPNRSFNVKFGLIRFDDLEEYILNRLEKELPKHLFYHNVKHTMDVTIGVEIIGTAEGVNEEELLILKTAGLFHDMGQIVQSNGHEEISCKFAHDILPKYNYDQDQIELICEVIMATKLPPNPQTLLQKIICDADLDYLGRTDFIPVSDTLYKELHEQNIIDNINDWNKLQVSFISNHQYFTEFARNNREVNKQKQIDRLKKLIN